MLDGLNKSIDVQLEVFEKIISKNKKLMKILDILESYILARNQHHQLSWWFALRL